MYRPGVVVFPDGPGILLLLPLLVLLGACGFGLTATHGPPEETARGDSAAGDSGAHTDGREDTAADSGGADSGGDSPDSADSPDDSPTTCLLLSDDVETAAVSWSRSGGWARTQETAASGTWSWSDSPGGNYRYDADTWLLSPPLDVSGQAELTVRFRHVLSYESCSTCDHAFVDVTYDGSRWIHLWEDEGADVLSWTAVTLQTSPTKTSNGWMYLRFRLVSDASIEDDGWHVDDIEVEGAAPCN